MTVQQHQLLSFVKQVLERNQPKRAICDLCGVTLTGWEAEETVMYGESVPNHQCQVDEQSREIVRRTWNLLTHSPARTRAKGYAVR